ncbi:MAG: hypothetical protein NVSMB19_26810 [Vulcanimicrobiaceae bacterium]
MAAHSSAFALLRAALLQLADEERRRVADLVGAMHDAKPPISGELAGVLAMIAALDPTDRRRLAQWCARYLSRWGQIPVAASRRLATPTAGSEARAPEKRP